MNDEVVQDLKQFIAATVHQEISGVESRIEEKLVDMEKLVKDEVHQVNKKIDDIDIQLSDMDAKLDTVIDATGEKFEGHEQRIATLETKAA